MFRLIIAAGISGTLILARFHLFNTATVLWLHSHLVYWMLMGAIVWCVVAHWRYYSSGAPHLANILARHRIGVVTIFACAIFLQIGEPHELKVFNDEATHIVCSRVMHNDRVVSLPAGTHILYGQSYNFTSGPMSRMPLFSALLATLHDILGYRPGNVYILNGLLSFGILLLLYKIGNLFGGMRAGVFAVLLFTSLPLFAQVTTSGSYDLLNLFLILLLFINTRKYLNNEGVEGQELMISTGVLLALARYESILYLLIPVGAVILKWRRERTVSLSIPVMLSPIGVLPSFLCNYIMFRWDYTFSDLRGKYKLGGFFDTHHFSDHARETIYYLFNFDLNCTNSLLLTVFGVGGLVALWIAVCLRLKRGEAVAVEARLLAVFSGVVALMYCFVLCNFWSSPVDAAASRFILPLSAMLALGAAWAVNDLNKSKHFPRWLLVMAGFFVFTLTNSANAKASATSGMILPGSYEWFRAYVQTHDRGRTLYVDVGSGLYMACYGYPSISSAALNNAADRLPLYLEAKLYDEIVIHDVRWRIPNSDQWGVSETSEAISPRIQCDVIDEKSFAPNETSRILRYRRTLPLKDAEGKEIPGMKLKKDFKDENERQEYLLNLLLWKESTP